MLTFDVKVTPFVKWSFFSTKTYGMVYFGIHWGLKRLVWFILFVYDWFHHTSHTRFHFNPSIDSLIMRTYIGRFCTLQRVLMPIEIKFGAHFFIIFIRFIFHDHLHSEHVRTDVDGWHKIVILHALFYHVYYNIKIDK